MHTLDFYFDCSSPWSYLAFEQAQRLFEGCAVTLRWRPCLVGGVFNTVNPSVYTAREHPIPAKQRYARKDLQDWARLTGLVIGQPPVFPVNSVKAMRGAFVALEHGLLVPYARAVFEAYWRDLADISQDDVLRGILAATGLDTAEYFAKIAQDHYKALLRTCTDELIARGGFGVPTFFLDGEDMYFGNDRLGLIRQRLDVGA